MSYDVECPIDGCDEEPDIRGLSGHLRLGHGLDADQAAERVEMARQTVPPSDDPNQQASAGAHASQVRADGNGGGSDQPAMCSQCGRSDEVYDAEVFAEALRSHGHSVPEQLHKYQKFCKRCEYAFDA